MRSSAPVGTSGRGGSGFGRRSAGSGGLRTSTGTRKKIVLRSFNLRSSLPEDFETKTWSKLREAVLAVHEQRAISCSLEELYNDVKNMCTNKLADTLYRNLCGELDGHIGKVVGALGGSTGADAVAHLEELERVWQQHCDQTKMIRSIFLYLDRTFMLQSAAERSLWDLGLDLFRKHFEATPGLADRVLTGVLRMIREERQGETVSRGLLQGLLKMYSALGIYKQRFEGEFLQGTTRFYRAEAGDRLAQLDVPAYLQHVDRRVEEERERVVRYLDPGTKLPLVHRTLHELVEEHAESLLGRGLQKMVSEQQQRELALMYKLLCAVNKQKEMVDKYREYVKVAGAAIVQDEARDAEMVQTVLDFKDRLDELLGSSFEQNDAFTVATKESFVYFINLRENRPAELVAKFLDSKLRSGGSKGLSEEEREVIMDKTLNIFRFINGKDVFQKYYAKDLAKRLLLGRSSSVDAEKSMITRLKAECGSGFTNKLEGMFKDMDLSKDTMESFRQSKVRQEIDFDMHVQVLTMGYWPPYPTVDIKLPPQMEKAQNIFRDFYLSKHSGRRLQWQNTLGHCVLKVDFAKKSKQLSVSLFQSAVLLLFNHQTICNYKEIRDRTGLEEGELKRTLQSLACAKVRPLVKAPKGAAINEDDRFKVNMDFKHQLYRIRINQIQMKETKEEREKTNESVFQDRQYQIDAAIVRILKTRKSIIHTTLMSELYKLLKFPFKASDMKKRIESLIERDYMARDTDDAQTYVYVA